jgi:hypothetical protein
VLLTKYCYDDKINRDEMGETCSRIRDKQNLHGRNYLGDSNEKMLMEHVNWTEPVQYRAFVDSTMNFRIRLCDRIILSVHTLKINNNEEYGIRSEEII